MIEEIIKKISKPATGFDVGGFKPSDDIKSSWFGKVLVCEQGESWPKSNDLPMIPLCQINLVNLPFIPDNLKDFQFITIFIDSKEIPIDNEENGNLWCLRAYKDIDKLIKIDNPNYNSQIKPFQLKPKFIENDCPCWEDCPIEIPDEIENNYEDYIINKDGIKIGGWPSLIQSEIYWGQFNQDSETPEYAFQIDSIEKANWFWGDSGIGYFGRSKTKENDCKWHFTWQCY